LRHATQHRGITEVTRGKGKMTVPRLGYNRVKADMERPPRGSYRLTTPRICCIRVKVSMVRMTRGSYRLTAPRIGCDKGQGCRGETTG
jgi:hypothetical protein